MIVSRSYIRSCHVNANNFIVTKNSGEQNKKTKKKLSIKSVANRGKTVKCAYICLCYSIVEYYHQMRLFTFPSCLHYVCLRLIFILSTKIHLILDITHSKRTPLYIVNCQEKKRIYATS